MICYLELTTSAWESCQLACNLFITFTHSIFCLKEKSFEWSSILIYNSLSHTVSGQWVVNNMKILNKGHFN